MYIILINYNIPSTNSMIEWTYYKLYNAIVLMVLMTKEYSKQIYLLYLDKVFLITFFNL